MSPLRIPVVGLILVTSVVMPSRRLWAQEGERLIVVDVSGTKTIAKETILSKVQTKPGGPYQDAIISEDIRRIFALGYFTDVKATVETSPEGLKLIFVVKEKPAVTSVQVEGTHRVPLARVRELLEVREGDLSDPRKLKEGVDRLKAEYVRKGYPQCEVVSKAQVNEAANTATIYLLIDEGPHLSITQVLVEGNQAFSDRRIQRLLKTRRQWWFQPGRYNEQVLEEDLERIRTFYRRAGYQDVDVRHTVYRDPTGAGLDVHFTIQEGLQHRVGQVAVDGTVLFPEREIREVITLKPGTVYHEEALQEDLRLIKQYYGDRGYIHAQVTPHVQLDQETKRVNLTYHLTEQELVYVNRIELQGNLRTQDVVIRRELRIFPGEPFNGAHIRKSMDRLYNLGYFDEVSVDTQPTERAEREDLMVKVKEAKTGSFSFGGGFSSVDRLVGLVEVEQRNFDWRNVPSFTGAGEDLRFKVEVGTVRRFFDLSFTEPWIFGHPVSFGLDAFSRTRLRSRNLGLAFEEEQQGGGIRLSKEFADAIEVATKYQLFQTKVSDVAAEASADLKAEEGRSTISTASVSVSLDRRDNRFDPTRGLFAFASADLAGGPLGADRDFYRLQAGVSSYLPHAGPFVFESHARAGIVDAFADTSEVPIFERFFGGGSGTIRGFRERRVGPTDPKSNDPIGGEGTFLGTLEEVMTIVKDERGRPILKGSVFLDVGNVWRRVADFGESFKAGTGLGVRVNTPIGPVRLDLGFPISDVGDEPRKPRFHFNLSRSF